MQIEESTLRRALLGVLDACGVDRYDDGVPWAMLRERWRDTGLRESDLRDAVRILAERGQIILREAGNTLGVGLSDEGRAALRRRPIELGSLRQDIHDQLVLLRARMRRRGSGAAGQLRRADDPH